MLFRLGSGLGFTYWETRQMPLLSIDGRGVGLPDLEEKACVRLGVFAGTYLEFK